MVLANNPFPWRSAVQELPISPIGDWPVDDALDPQYLPHLRCGIYMEVADEQSMSSSQAHSCLFLLDVQRGQFSQRQGFQWRSDAVEAHLRNRPFLCCRDDVCDGVAALPALARPHAGAGV